MKGILPIYESKELKVYRYGDEFVRYFDNQCYCGEPGPFGNSPCEMILASSILDAGTEETYIAEITGDSMCEADIRKGDKVVINTQKRPADGDIVLAIVEGDVLLKYLQHDEEGNAWLVPANSCYKPMMVDFKNSDNSIIGVMTSLIRQRPKFNAVLRGRLNKTLEEYRSVKITDDSKPIFKCLSQEKDRHAILDRLHCVLDGKEGVYVVKVLIAAKSLNYLTALPSHGVLTEEFGVRISKTQYYRDKENKYTEHDLADILESLT